MVIHQKGPTQASVEKTQEAAQPCEMDLMEHCEKYAGFLKNLGFRWILMDLHGFTCPTYGSSVGKMRSETSLCSSPLLTNSKSRVLGLVKPGNCWTNPKGPKDRNRKGAASVRWQQPRAMPNSLNWIRPKGAPLSSRSSRNLSIADMFRICRTKKNNVQDFRRHC